MLKNLTSVLRGTARQHCGRFAASALGIALLAMTFWLTAVDFAAAHHVLGRRSSALNEDSNTPPAMQGEALIGDYFVTYMVFPAFPRPEVPGRIHLYITRDDDGTPFQGEVTFKVREVSWLSWLGVRGKEEKLGVQPPDDNVFRQSFLFHEAGDYVISTKFEADGEPYVIDVPLRIGAPASIGPIGVAVGLLAFVLVTVSVIQRRRSMTGKIRSTREERG